MVLPPALGTAAEVIGTTNDTRSLFKWLLHLVLKLEPVYRVYTNVTRGKPLDMTGSTGVDAYRDFWHKVGSDTIRADTWVEIDGYISRYIPLLPGLVPTKLNTADAYRHIFDSHLRGLRETSPPHEYLERRLLLKHESMLDYGLGMLRPPGFRQHVVLGLSRGVVEFGIPILMSQDVFERSLSRPFTLGASECVYARVTGQVRAFTAPQITELGIAAGLDNWLVRRLQERLGILPSVMLIVREPQDIRPEPKKEVEELFGRAWAQYVLRDALRTDMQQQAFLCLWAVDNVFQEARHKAAVNRMNALVHTYATEIHAHHREVLSQYDHYRNRFGTQNLLELTRDGTFIERDTTLPAD